jgi:hypothetical protein
MARPLQVQSVSFTILAPVNDNSINSECCKHTCRTFHTCTFISSKLKLSIRIVQIPDRSLNIVSRFVDEHPKIVLKVSGKFTAKPYYHIQYQVSEVSTLNWELLGHFNGTSIRPRYQNVTTVRKLPGIDSERERRIEILDVVTACIVC